MVLMTGAKGQGWLGIRNFEVAVAVVEVEVHVVGRTSLPERRRFPPLPEPTEYAECCCADLLIGDDPEPFEERRFDLLPPVRVPELEELVGLFVLRGDGRYVVWVFADVAAGELEAFFGREDRRSDSARLCAGRTPQLLSIWSSCMHVYTRASKAKQSRATFETQGG